MMTNNLKHTKISDVVKVKHEPDEFEDDEFEEDNKALNDQGEGEGTNSFLSSLNSSSSNSSGSGLTFLTSQGRTSLEGHNTLFPN